MKFDPKKLIFIHGLEGSSQGVKANMLRDIFPEMLIPDFPGSLDERMSKLCQALGDESGWTIIGSSFGGLMGALFTCQRPQQVRKLVLLAPALIWPDFVNHPPPPLDVPTVVYHGRNDTLIPLDLVQRLAASTFRDLQFYAVDDDHGLYKTVHEIDWRQTLS